MSNIIKNDQTMTLKNNIQNYLPKSFSLIEGANGYKIWVGHPNGEAELIITTSFELQFFQSFLKAFKRLNYLEVVEHKTVKDFSSLRIRLKRPKVLTMLNEDLADMLHDYVPGSRF